MDRLLNRRRLLLALLFAFHLSWPAVGYAAEKRLAVLEFQGKKVEAETLTTFSDAVRSGALEGLAKSGVHVMTRENMLSLLKDMGKAECAEGECEVETARNIGADYVVSGIVASIEDRYVVTLKLHESKAGSLLGTELVKARTQLEILDALREQSRDLIRAHLARSRASTSTQDKRIEVDGDFAAQDDRVLVRFESEPPGATVLLDGDLLCKETPCSKAVHAGPHDVEMQRERYERVQQRIDAQKGIAVRSVLPANFATLTVETEPAGLTIALDGRAQGPGLALLEVDPGTHEVVIDDPCFQPTGQQVTLKKNEHRQIRVTASPRQSAIAVTAENERGDDVEVRVAVDGVVVGMTPGTFKTAVCSKELLVSFDHGKFRKTLKLAEKEVTQVRAKLETNTAVPTEAVTAAASQATSGWRTAGLITASVGVVGIGAGIYFGHRAQSLSDELESSTIFNSQKDDDRKAAIALQYIGYAAGTVAVAGGVAMYVFDRAKARVALVPSVSPQYAGLSMLGFFQ